MHRRSHRRLCLTSDRARECKPSNKQSVVPNVASACVVGARQGQAGPDSLEEQPGQSLPLLWLSGNSCARLHIRTTGLTQRTLDIPNDNRESRGPSIVTIQDEVVSIARGWIPHPPDVTDCTACSWGLPRISACTSIQVQEVCCCRFSPRGSSRPLQPSAGYARH